MLIINFAISYTYLLLSFLRKTAKTGDLPMKSIESRFSPHHSHSRRVLFSGHGLRNLYEHRRIFFCLSHVHEPADLRRFPGICGCGNAVKPFRSDTDLHHGGFNPGTPSVLRTFHAGKIQRSWLEKILSDFRRCACLSLAQTLL